MNKVLISASVVGGAIVLMLVGSHLAIESFIEQAAEGVTPLMAESINGDLEKVSRLLHAGADPDTRVDMLGGWTPLIGAARRGHTDVVIALLDAGADPNGRDSFDWVALHHTIQHDIAHVDTIEVLVAGGADLGALDNHRRTVLHRAAHFGHPVAVRKLLELGARTDGIDERGMTPLERGAGFADVVRAFEESR